MNATTRATLALFLFSAATDAFAQGAPRRVAFALGGAAIGGIIGFLLGLWWCRRCNDKKRDKADQSN